MGHIDHGEDDDRRRRSRRCWRGIRRATRSRSSPRSTRRPRSVSGDHDQDLACGSQDARTAITRHVECGRRGLHQEHDHWVRRRWTGRFWWCRRRMVRCLRPNTCASARQGGRAGDRGGVEGGWVDDEVELLDPWSSRRAESLRRHESLATMCGVKVQASRRRG